MTFSMRRVSAIFRKEVQDFKNKFTSVVNGIFTTYIFGYI